jgi:hypothetical protein
VNWISSLSGSVSLKVNVGVVETPVAPDDGAVKVGVLGTSSTVKKWSALIVP